MWAIKCFAIVLNTPERVDLRFSMGERQTGSHARRKGQKMMLDNLKQAILDYLRAHGTTPKFKVRSDLGCDEADFAPAVNALVDEGKIKTDRILLSLA